MWIGQRRTGIAIFGTGNAGAVERGDALAYRVALRPSLDDLHHRVPVRAARRHGRKSAVFGKFALSRHLAKRREIARCDGRDQNIAVLGADWTVRRARRLVRKLRLLQFVDQQVQHAIHQGDVDALALARPRALHQRGLNGGVAKNSAQHVGDEDGSRSGSVPVPGIAHERTVETTLGVNDHGIGCALGCRSGLPVAGDRAKN